MKKLLFFLAGFILLSSFLLMKTISADNNNSGQVTICHSNNDANNPYVTESPDIQNNGTLSGGHLNDTGPLATSLSVAQSLKNSHTQWGDIIPPYNFYTCPSGYQLNGTICTQKNQPNVNAIPESYAGLNWTTIGQAMLHNNCGFVTSVCTDPNATNYVANPNSAQYSDNSTCTYTPAGTCPTACGQLASTVADGKGGTISCSATPACIKECTDETALNFYDNEIDPTTQIADNSVCQYAATITPTPTVTPTPTIDPCANNACVTPTATPTPTSTQTSTNSGGGDGLSDGLGCGSHPCGGSSSTPTQSVLGANTGPEQAVLGASTMASTGTFDNNLMNFMLLIGTIIFGAGLTSYAKEKNR